MRYGTGITRERHDQLKPEIDGPRREFGRSKAEREILKKPPPGWPTTGFREELA